MTAEHELTPLLLVALVLPAYLIGSIAFGVLVARWMKLGDVRDIGSGNIGASNVLRTGSKVAAAFTLVLDMGKGAVPVLLFSTLGNLSLIAGLAALLGHLFPIWHRFRGGKGFATFLGVLFAFSPVAGVATALTWLAVAAVLRISSCASLSAALLAPLWIFLVGVPTAGPREVLLAVPFMSILIWIKHLPNIQRLIRGAEPKIDLRAPRKQSASGASDDG